MTGVIPNKPGEQLATQEDLKVAYSAVERSFGFVPGSERSLTLGDDIDWEKRMDENTFVGIVFGAAMNVIKTKKETQDVDIYIYRRQDPDSQVVLKDRLQIKRNLGGVFSVIRTPEQTYDGTWDNFVNPKEYVPTDEELLEDALDELPNFDDPEETIKMLNIIAPMMAEPMADKRDASKIDHQVFGAPMDNISKTDLYLFIEAVRRAKLNQQ